MAKADTQFRKGQSGNPSGRPKGIISTDEIRALMGRFWGMTREQLHGVVQDPKSSMGDIMVAAVMAKAAKDGDYSRLSFLLDRMVGRPTEVVEQHNINHDRQFAEANREKLIELLKPA